MPNIKGSGRWNYIGYTDTGTFDGALNVNENSNPTVGSVDGNNAQDRGYSITFNASLSNAIYGASSTVQPPALKLIAQIRF